MSSETIHPPVEQSSPPSLARRGFLRRGGVGAVATAVAALSAPELALAQSGAAPPTPESNNLPPHVAEWTKTLGAPTASPYGTPSEFETKAIRNLYPGLKEPMSAYSTTPLQELDGIVTPNGLHYERHHAGVPQVDPAQHRLMIHGLTNKSMVFTMDEIRQFPSISCIYFLECSGNPSFLPPYGKTAAEVAGLVSGAQWMPNRLLRSRCRTETVFTWTTGPMRKIPAACSTAFLRCPRGTG